MQELTRKDLENLVALQSNKYKKDVSLILDTYYTVLREAILTGYKVTVPGVGTYSNSQLNSKKERNAAHPVTGKPIVLSAHEAYNKPTFKFKPSIKQEMREATEGNVF